MLTRFSPPCQRRSLQRCLHNSAAAAAAVFTCARHLAHGPAAPPSAQAIKLRRALWMRMHPVERWTSLVDLGRRAVYLLEKPQAPPGPTTSPPSSSSTTDDPSSLTGKRLGSGDDRVYFSEAATAAHRELCAALPYAARLHLCISLLMWIRCLRDVQDTLARVRLPYASVRRPQRYAVADVFPTRLSEYWVDVHTTVSTKMSTQLNSTAEQVPAPHTWNVETSETVEDAATESTVTLDAGRVLHGRSRQDRLTGRTLLRQVQGVEPRASADDAAAARLTDGGSASSRQRRRRRVQHQQQQRGLLSSSSGGDGGTDGSSSSSSAAAVAVEGTDALSAQRTQRTTSLEFQPDAARRVAPVSLEPQPHEDAAYHGNLHRGEGCPMSDDGASTPNPIYIHVPSRTTTTTAKEDDVEALLRCCVMAHAAVLSSLYIEGRVVDFSTNHTVVAAYVRWLFEEHMTDAFLHVTLVAPEAVSLYRPYFPAWSMRSVMVVLPPKYTRSAVRRRRFGWGSTTGGCYGGGGGDDVGYSRAVVLEWASRIVQAAPCSVLVEGGDATVYVAELKEEVRRLQSLVLSSTACDVEWVSVATVLKTPPPSRVEQSCVDDGEETTAAAPAFHPRRSTTSSTFSLASVVTAALHRLSGQSSTKRKEKDDNHGVDVSARFATRQQRFLAAVQETLRDRFYQCELLYSPTQSCLSPYRFERWVWEELPDNVRVVGVNTAPVDTLFYFPQGVFLTQKVGNAFRYRAIERTVVAKGVVPSWTSHPLRHTAMTLHRLCRRWGWKHGSSGGGGGDVAGGLHAELALVDRHRMWRTAARKRNVSDPTATTAAAADAVVEDDLEKEEAAQALVRERVVEYLAEPSKSTLLGLAAARFFRV